jgi:hypothetical protein
MHSLSQETEQCNMASSSITVTYCDLRCTRKMTNRCVKEFVDFINVFQILPRHVFRQVVAIFRGSYVPYKLLEQCLCLYIHLHTNSTQNTGDGTHITITTKKKIQGEKNNNYKKKLTRLDYGLDDSGFKFKCNRQKIYLLYCTKRPDGLWGPPSLLWMGTRGPTPGVKLPWRETRHLLATSNETWQTDTLHYNCILCCTQRCSP